MRVRFDRSNSGGDNARGAAAIVHERVKGAAAKSRVSRVRRDDASAPHVPARDAPMTAAYAAVALVPAVPGRDLLTYRVDEAQRGRIAPGMRVVVPLGRRRETGIVV